MTTTYSPIAAFGTAIIRCETPKGESRLVTLGENGLVTTGYYFYTKGEVECVVEETGEVLENRKAGWLNLDHPASSATSSGTLKVTALEDTEWFCISTKFNSSKALPLLKAVVIQPNDCVLLENKTNFFLARGSIKVGDTQLTGPRQVRVRSGDINILNYTNETVYGLIVLNLD